MSQRIILEHERQRTTTTTSDNTASNTHSTQADSITDSTTSKPLLDLTTTVTRAEILAEMQIENADLVADVGALKTIPSTSVTKNININSSTTFTAEAATVKTTTSTMITALYNTSSHGNSDEKAAASTVDALERRRLSLEAKKQYLVELELLTSKILFIFFSLLIGIQGFSHFYLALKTHY